MDFNNVSDEVYKFVANEMHAKLKERVKASVYVRVSDEDHSLYCRISNLGLSFVHQEGDITSYVHNGNVESLINDIVAGYRKFVLNSFFK